MYQLGQCRRALLEKTLTPDDRENGFSRHDLEETSMAAILDEARSLSLFSPNRVVWVVNAEAALPRGRAAGDDEKLAQSALAEYVRHPTPGTVLVFEASRYSFDGEDKSKLERVKKFYAVIPNQVEFRPYTMEAARRLAQDCAKEAGLQIRLAELGLLVESLAADPSRLVNEIEKLRLYTAGTRKVTPEDIALLVPNAQESTLFALVAALGRGDRKGSLGCLGALLREGEYCRSRSPFSQPNSVWLWRRGTRFCAARNRYRPISPSKACGFGAHAEQVQQTMTASPSGET